MSLISNYKKLKEQYVAQKREVEKLQRADHLEKKKKQINFEKAKMAFEGRNKFS